MVTYQLIAIAVAMALAGGVVAAKIIGLELWRGAAVAAASSALAIAALLVPGFDRSLAVPLGALVGAGISGALLGLSAPVTANLLIGIAVPPMLAFLAMEMAA